MQDFTIIVEETLRREVKITASDPIKAMSQAMDEYHEGTIVLDEKDFDGDTQFKYVKET